jgi:Predicted transcriptional regulator
MDMKLYNSELNIMNVLWDRGDTTAKELVKILKDETGWSKSTTYTIISRCINKGLIANIDDKFTCHALVDKDDVRKYETKELIQNMFDGSADKLIASMIDGKYLSDEEVVKLKKYIAAIDTEK